MCNANFAIANWHRQMLKPSKPTIFELLDNIQVKNSAYYKSLPPEQRQLFAPYLAMKWLSTAASDDQLLLVNDLANSKVFALGHSDPLLMFDVLSACTTGRKTRYKWVKRPMANKPIERALQEYYGAHADISALARTITEADLTQICQQLGYQDSEIAALLKKPK